MSSPHKYLCLDADFLNQAIQFASRLADIGREVTLSYFRQNFSIENKLSDAFDPVTEADKLTEKAMRKLIESERPEDGIVGEEFGIKESQSGWHWYLDPIDGTRSFIMGAPWWTSLIGFVKGEKPVLGVIDAPALGERYMGWPGGASLQIATTPPRPIQVNSCLSLTQSVLATTDPYLFTPPEVGAFMHLRQTAKLTRYGMDAYAYARLAAGDIDLVVESDLCPHDVAALIPVITGAGGVACDWTGAPAGLGSQLVAAASEKLLCDTLPVLKRAADERAKIY